MHNIAPLLKAAKLTDSAYAMVNLAANLADK